MPPSDDAWPGVWRRLYAQPQSPASARRAWFLILRHSALLFRQEDRHPWICYCGMVDSTQHAYVSCPGVRDYWSAVWGLLRCWVPDLLPAAPDLSPLGLVFGWPSTYSRLGGFRQLRFHIMHALAIEALSDTRYDASRNQRVPPYRPALALSRLRAALLVVVAPDRSSCWFRESNPA